MALTDYTSYAEVRSVLGVEDDELTDGILSLDLYASGLLTELEEVDTGLPTDFATVAAIDPASNRTAAQRRFYDATRNFATYGVAFQLSTSLPMFGPKEISDSKSLVSRFTDSPYKETNRMVKEKYDQWKARLEKAYSEFKSADTTPTRRLYLVASTLSTDPVTQ